MLAWLHALALGAVLDLDSTVFDVTGTARQSQGLQPTQARGAPPIIRCWLMLAEAKVVGTPGCAAAIPPVPVGSRRF